MILKAPYIVTMEGPVLKDHAIWVEGEKIVRIAPQKEFSKNGERRKENGERIDLLKVNQSFIHSITQSLIIKNTIQ